MRQVIIGAGDVDNCLKCGWWNGWDGHCVLCMDPAECIKAEAKLKRLVEALRAALFVMDRGPQPRKLDEALTWRENDEQARKMIADALKPFDNETDFAIKKEKQ